MTAYQCRGVEKDLGVAVQSDAAQRNPTVAMANAGRPRPVRLQDDMLISYATVPGYVSYRNPDSGTWFISAICEVVSQCQYIRVARHLQIGNMFLSFRCSQNIRGKKTWRRCWWLWTGTLETDLMMVEPGRLQRRQVEDSTRSSSLIQAFEYVRTAAMSTKKKQLQHTSWCAELNPVFQYHYREREMKIIFQTTSSMSRHVRDVPYYYRETKKAQVNLSKQDGKPI